MLLLHGFTGSGASWPPSILDGLVTSGVLPVPVDLPGHGRHAGDADPAHFTLEATLAAVAAAQGGEPCPVAGYSMGGRLALAYALAHPDRVTRLVLESASPGLRTGKERAARRAADEALARALEADGIEAFVGRWESLPLFETQAALPEDVRAAQRNRRLANAPESLAASLRGVGTGALPSFWASLPRLTMPVLLLTGAMDPRFRAVAEEMAAALPRAEAVVVPGAGHAVHLERPDAWLSSVVAFLSAGRGASGRESGADVRGRGTL